MEENFSLINQFLKDFCNNKLSPSGDESAHLAVGSYSLYPEEVFGEVIIWVLTYLEQTKCPCELAIAVANIVATRLSSLASIQHASTNSDGDGKNWKDASVLYEETVRDIQSSCTLFLNHPNEMECCVPFISKRFDTSAFAIKNKRRKMEDRHVVIHDLNGVLNLKNMPPHSYYAVFDGHAGVEAASYAASQLHINLAKHPDFLSDITKALKESYLETDKNILEKSENENWKSGCTAVSVLIRERTVYLTWLGDSQALLVKQGRPIAIMDPHKPDREDERKRIEALGGDVTHYGTWRVNGILAVSRALGDPDHKPFVSNEPDINILELDGTEDFLILACDGLWDEVSADQVATTLYQYVNDSSITDPVGTIASKLVHQSKLQGSDDNISIIVVFLREVQSIIDDSSKFLTLFTPVDNKNDAYDWITKCPESEKSIQNCSLTKPSVLELNGAAGKKANSMTNTFNIPYNLQNVDQSEGSFDLQPPALSSSKERSSDYNSSIGFAPEATALSELPTPPIDDVLASQQFAQLCANDLYQGLDQVTSDLNFSNFQTDLQESSNPFNNPFQENFAMEVVKDEHLHSDISHEGNRSENKLPAEAIGIATKVVINAIETAVQCVSSNESDSQSSPVLLNQKLNPYAEPFVMKSFFVQEESDLSTASPMSIGQIEQCDVLSQSNNLINHLGNFIQDTSALPNCSKNELNQIDDLIKSHGTLNSKVPEISETEIIKKSISDADLILEQGFKDNINISHESGIKHETVVKNNLTQDDLNLLDYENQDVQNDPDLLNSEINQKAIVEGNLILDQPVPDMFKNTCEFGTLTNQNLIISTTQSEISEVKSELAEVISKLTEAKSELPQVKSELPQVKSELPQVKSELPEGKSELVLTEEKSKPAFINSEPLEVKSELAKIFIPEHGENQATLLLDVEEKFLKTAGSELSEDNVYLQSVPDGIPEAEGVTEDIDSDSEKDGGWSYMKGNPLPSDKTAAIRSLEGAKIEKNIVENTALLQNIKSTLDTKVKVKNVPLDKSQKTVAAKKPTDLKDTKIKTRIRGATIPNVLKTNTEKPKLTSSRMKKEPASSNPKPVVAAVPSKPLRSTLQRNSLAPAKTNTISATALRPKSAVPLTSAAKVTQARPSSLLPSTKTSTTTSLVRNVTSRPAMSSTINRTSLLSKPSTLSKSSSVEVKVRPVSTVPKKPMSDIAKKPDIKEKKNSVNTQILTGKFDPFASKERKIVTSTPKPMTATKKLVPSNERSVVGSRVAPPPAKAETDKKDITKQPVRNINKTFATSKSTKELKSRIANVRSSNNVSEKIKKRVEADTVENSKVESCQANASEQEKFILETNIKENVSDEQETVKSENELFAISQGQGAVAETSVTEIPSEAESALPNVI